ncbi:MAG: 3-deoxy-D-manno-octulosonic acid transferase [Bacteroidetes bacterium]|nr:MAG: 3-deoxy-D-manno-octulosonic acid transferase [Bacteroidota bacterium]
MHIIYNSLIRLYTLLIRLAAVFDPKAAKWVAGRQAWQTRYRASFEKKGALLWIHAASLGEFEQGRPVIEAFRKQFPEWQVLLSFFSPSGYEMRRQYPHADQVVYLPADTPENAREFLDIFQPDLAIFIKYEFWANYLFELQNRAVPVILISAVFRQDQPFFRFYGGLWRRMLSCFDHFFIQNEAASGLLAQLNIRAVTVAGDTRIDRVLQLAEQAVPNPVVQAFATGGHVLIAGSTWKADEDLLLAMLDSAEGRGIRMVIAPHEPSDKHLAQLMPRLSAAVRYSEFVQTDVLRPDQVQRLQESRVLVIDNIGMLNTLYRYGWAAYIGGGLGKGIHNTLEPAAFGLPILFGPRYHKFEEAQQFVARGGAFPVTNADDLKKALAQLTNPDRHQKASNAVLQFLNENRGGTGRVIGYLTTRISA